jgi:hypothetical protein
MEVCENRDGRPRIFVVATTKVMRESHPSRLGFRTRANATRGETLKPRRLSDLDGEKAKPQNVLHCIQTFYINLLLVFLLCFDMYRYKVPGVWLVWTYACQYGKVYTLCLRLFARIGRVNKIMAHATGAASRVQSSAGRMASIYLDVHVYPKRYICFNVDTGASCCPI